MIDQITDFIKKNTTLVISCSVILVIAILLFISLTAYKKTITKRSYINEYNAYKLYKNYDQKSWPVVENAFLDNIKKDPKTKGGLITRLYLGNIYFKIEQYQKAINTYAGLLKYVDKESNLYDLASIGMAYSYENLGDFQKSLSFFQKVTEKKNSAHTVQAFIAMGRCYEGLKDNHSAVEKYRMVNEKFPENPWKTILNDKISELSTSN
jgi:tetratricopeptide (TPR) repeat protein